MIDDMDKVAAHAQSVQDQHIERMADEMRGLVRDEPEFLAAMSRMLNAENTEAAAAFCDMRHDVRFQALQWIIPLARIGLFESLEAMRRKHGGDQ